MDASAVLQYRYLLALLVAGLLVSSIIGYALSRTASASAEPPPRDAHARAQRQILPSVMLLLVALAAASGVIILLPAAMIFRFMVNGPVLAAVLFVLAVIAAPLLYAWRARPFS